MELKQQLDELKSALEQSFNEKYNTQIADLKSKVAAAEEKAANAGKEEIAQLKNELEGYKAEVKNFSKDLETIDARVKSQSKAAPVSKKSFSEVWKDAINEAFESKASEIKAFQKDRNAVLNIQLDTKIVGNMLLSSNLTGDGVASYGPNQGIVPSQKINFRDLMPTTPSPTGLYVTYRETGSEGSISAQTEGNSKTQIDYDLTEVKVVSDYVAGFARFSKQMMFQLPFLENTLQRMLIRDFYKAENARFYTAVSTGATGSTTAVTGLTDNDAEEMLGFIINQINANFEASYALVNPTQWGRILATNSSDYSVPGGFVMDPNGNIRIAGVPVIAAPWVADDKVLIVDSSYLERVETESMNIQFAYEDSDNFTKNLVTARIECFEDVNLLRTDAFIFGDFGNIS